MKHEKPWLKSDGTHKSDREIKRSCKDWSPSVWENYLRTVEIEQEEILLDDPLLTEEYSQEEHDLYCRSVFDVKDLPNLKEALLQAFEGLTSKQKQVLNQIFFEKMNLREVGYCIGISSHGVARIRDRALRSVGLILVQHMTCGTSKAQKKKRGPLNKKEKTKNEIIESFS